MKPKKLGWYKKKLDLIYSQYIRLRDSDKYGNITCYGCGRKIYWKEAQNSHYISRSHNATRYMDENCRSACIGCNMFKSGAMDEYALFIIKTYGVKMLEKLRFLKWQRKQFTIPELQEKIAYYQNKLKELNAKT